MKLLSARVTEALAEGDARTVAELTEITGRTPNYVYRIVLQMLDAGLLERRERFVTGEKGGRPPFEYLLKKEQS